ATNCELPPLVIADQELAARSRQGCAVTAASDSRIFRARAYTGYTTRPSGGPWHPRCVVRRQQIRPPNVRFGSEADIGACPRHVPFTPKSRHWNSVAKCPLCANSGHQFGLELEGASTLLRTP